MIFVKKWQENEAHTVTYEFTQTQYTTETLKWVWYDGPGAPEMHSDLELPDGAALPDQGAMFMEEKVNYYYLILWSYLD